MTHSKQKKVQNKVQNKDNLNNSIKIKVSDDIEINGNVYFIPDKYIENKFLSTEYKQLYKLLLVLYLDLQITTHKIENITSITKLHIANGITIVDKLISYIYGGKLYITHLTALEKSILEKIPENLIHIINPLIIEKIEL